MQFWRTLNSRPLLFTFTCIVHFKTTQQNPTATKFNFHCLSNFYSSQHRRKWYTSFLCALYTMLFIVQLCQRQIVEWNDWLVNGQYFLIFIEHISNYTSKLVHFNQKEKKVIKLINLLLHRGIKNVPKLWNAKSSLHKNKNIRQCKNFRTHFES